MNLYSEELLQVLHEPGVVQLATSWFPLHQQVEVARRGRFFASQGTERSESERPVAFGKAQHLFALFAAQIPPASR